MVDTRSLAPRQRMPVELEGLRALVVTNTHTRIPEETRRSGRRANGNDEGAVLGRDGAFVIEASGGDGGESNSPSRTFCRSPLRACPMVCRRTTGLPSAASRPLQSHPLSGFAQVYVTLNQSASPLNDASTAHRDEAASTLTLPPKRRRREQAGGCQLLLFAAFLRGQTAPRLAFLGIRALSRPRIPGESPRSWLSPREDRQCTPAASRTRNRTSGGPWETGPPLVEWGAAHARGSVRRWPAACPGSGRPRSSPRRAARRGSPCRPGCAGGGGGPAGADDRRSARRGRR